jgi:DNA-nicking Smr family endonuclease
MTDFRELHYFVRMRSTRHPLNPLCSLGLLCLLFPTLSKTLEPAKNHLMRKNKHNLPIFDNDQDYLKVFQANAKQKAKFSGPIADQITDPIKDEASGTSPQKRKQVKQAVNEISEPEEDFAKLLEESFQKNAAKPLKKPAPLPLKKRLKRYPPPEASLDLHGFTAIDAQIRAESFIYTCKMQGFFTVRIIVGKGRHSELGPVLPDVVEDVLNEMKRKNLVIGFGWDKKIKSQSGSIIVYLQQFERYD